MSFSHTTAQMRDRSKDVTRRLGWARLQPGRILQAIEKGMGLGKGGKVVPLGFIRVVSVRRERLDELVNLERPGYGEEEMRREGFPGMDPQDFMLRFFVESIDPSDLVTRIEFEHLYVRTTVRGVEASVDLTNAAGDVVDSLIVSGIAVHARGL